MTARLAVAVLSLALTCCSPGSGRQTPTADAALDIRPTLGVTPAMVPAGGPIAIDYRWTVGPTARPLSGRLRAFVHVIDDEGALLFTDDHEPTPPPAQWKPGTTCSYRRLTLTPEFPFAGWATVVVGLVRTGSGSRLALTGEDLGQRRYRVARLRLLPRDRDLPVRCEGFYEPEASVRAPLSVTRFMRREATCRFPNPHEDVVVFVRGDIEPEGFPAPPRLTISSTARRVAATWLDAELPLVPEPALLRVRVPARGLGSRPDAELTLRMSETYRPNLLGMQDPRELSLRVFGIAVGRAARLDPTLLEGPRSAFQ